MYAPPHTRKNQSLPDRLMEISLGLKSFSEADARVHFDIPSPGMVLKSTISLCDLCLKHVPAGVYRLNTRVFIKKRCASHGLREAVLENDADYYRLSNKDLWGRRYTEDNVVTLPAFTGCCGEDSTQTCAPNTNDAWSSGHTDQRSNKSCTVLVEITDACNLSCRVCYSDSKGDRILPFDTFKQHIQELVTLKGSLDSIQITGGEASLHPQFWEMIDWLYRQPGVRKIYLPTNGIELSKGDAAKKLRPYRDKVLVLLQFDGESAEANHALGRTNTRRIREKLIGLLDRAGIVMQLTMTIAKGVSETEIAWVVRQGIRHRHIRLIGMLPVFYSGRYDLPQDPVNRLTLSDVVKAASEGTDGKATPQDFMPIPCSHPNCGWTTLFARRFGMLFNIARQIDLEAVMNDVAYKTILTKNELRSVVGSRYRYGWRRLLSRVARRLIRPQDVFGIAIKPFMDTLNYDQDRVSSCCHHILNTHGDLVSFCEYNALMRQNDSWARFPTL